MNTPSPALLKERIPAKSTDLDRALAATASDEELAALCDSPDPKAAKTAADRLEARKRDPKG